MIEWAYQGYSAEVELKYTLPQVAGEIEEFFKQRIKGMMSDRGLSYDTVEAVLAVGFDDITDAFARGAALTSFRDQPAFNALMTAFNRANNLAKNATGGAINEAYLEHPAEHELYRQLTALTQKVQPLIQSRDYVAALREIAAIQAPLNEFFEQVMVMVEDERIKTNRLALLKNLVDLSKTVADFSKVVLEG